MHQNTFYCAGSSPASAYAAEYLRKKGFRVSTEPDWTARHLLLDVPSFRDGMLRNGDHPDTLLSALPSGIHIWGGNLQHPSLTPFHTTDLLLDEQYLITNAAITADCAMKIATPLLQNPWKNTTVLIIGWGRISKHLGKLLQDVGCAPVITSRNAIQRAALQSLGYSAADPGELPSILKGFQVIFNTAPATVIPADHSSLCANAIKIDLASKKGIEGPDVIWARGLPGIHAPERSGKLIADTIIRIMKEETA